MHEKKNKQNTHMHICTSQKNSRIRKAKIEADLCLAYLYESTERAIALPPVSALVSVLTKTLKFHVKVFKTLYLLNPQMDLVYIWYDYRCWSKILLSTIHIAAYDVQVKVTDLEILCLSFTSKFLKYDRKALFRQAVLSSDRPCLPVRCIFLNVSSCFLRKIR